MSRLPACLSACLLVALAFTAHAETKVYQWTDEEGVVHFSTEPPPAEVVEFEERPVVEAPKPGSVAPNYAPRSRETSVAEAPGAEDDDGERVSLAERDRIFEANCRAARQRVAAIEPAQLVRMRREDGTIVVLSGEERLAELEAARRMVEQYCK